MVAKHLNKQAGFLLVEILAVVALLGVLAGVLLPQSASYSKRYARLQVRAAANLLAADMRKLQQQTIFCEGEQRYLRSLSSGYDHYFKGKKVREVRFADYGWNVELTWPKRFNVQFGVNGGPTYSGTWVVQHSEVSGISCTVAVQPVTGRIVVSESE